jgi:hypothetical protein
MAVVLASCPVLSCPGYRAPRRRADAGAGDLTSIATWGSREAGKQGSREAPWLLVGRWRHATGARLTCLRRCVGLAERLDRAAGDVGAHGWPLEGAWWLPPLVSWRASNPCPHVIFASWTPLRSGGVRMRCARYPRPHARWRTMVPGACVQVQPAAAHTRFGEIGHRLCAPLSGMQRARLRRSWRWASQAYRPRDAVCVPSRTCGHHTRVCRRTPRPSSHSGYP